LRGMSFSILESLLTVARRFCVPLITLVSTLLLAFPANAAANWSDIAYIYLPSLVTSVAVAMGICAVLWAQREIRSVSKTADAQKKMRQAREGELFAAESVLSAAPSAIFIWPADQSAVDIGGDEDQSDSSGPSKAWGQPTVQGRIEGLIDPRQDSGAQDFSTMCIDDDARRLLSALVKLRRKGIAFKLFVQTKERRRFEVEGRPAGGQVAVWVRDSSSEQAEIGRLTELLAETQRTNNHLSELLDAIPVPIWRRDEGMNLTWANRAYVRTVDSDTLETVLSSQKEIDEGEVALTKSALTSGNRCDVTRHIVVGGERRAYKFEAVPADNGITGVGLDVTDLEDSIQQTTRHIAAHQDTLNKLRTAVAIFDADQRLTFHNSAFQKLWLLESDWLAGQPTDGEILEKLREARRLPEKANFPAWKKQHLSLYNKVIDQPEELWHLPDGRTLRVIVQPHPFGGLIYLYDDVTDELALESSYKLLINVQRATLDNLYEGVALFGTDGKLKLFNTAFVKLWDLDPQRLQGEPHFETVTEWCRPLLEDRREWKILAEGVTAVEGERVPRTGRIKRPDQVVVDYGVMPLPDGATLLYFLDVTDTSRIERALREKNEALEQADKLKSGFVGHMSYQLRTPLNTIIGYSSMLDQGINCEPLDQKQREYTGNVLQASNHLLRLIDDILDLAVIDAGRMILDLDRLDVIEVIESALPMAEEWAQHSQLKLKRDYTNDVGRIDVDARRLKQVVLNLVSNAVSHTQPGGEITVGAARNGSDITVWVKDTGEGISARAQASVFDPFEGQESGDGRRGAGLGLALVKRFVELHNGWVELESQPRRGTTVTCHFPESHFMHEAAE